MKSICVVFILCIAAMCIAAMFIAVASWAGEVVPSLDGKLSGGKFGEVYQCAFPNTVKLDGNLNEQPWQYAPWHTIDFDEGTGPAPDSDDATCTFAAVADDQWLYVALRITDDTIQAGETDDYKDDSIEIYIDANHAATAAYEGDDAQITIGAGNIDGDIQDPHITGSAGVADIGMEVAVVETADGWIVEAAIPLKNNKWDIKPKNGLIIGFNIHFNDDDTGGDRDHKLIWSLLDVDDQSWQNPSRFADLEFRNVQLAVSPGGKLAATWGNIKR